jgi:hypothetical protein
MKYRIIKIALPALLSMVAVAFTSCRPDLLDQDSTEQLSADKYWKTEDDALSAEAGMLSDVRYLFNRDYYLDGLGEYVRDCGNSFMNNSGYNGRAYMGRWDYLPWGFGGYFAEMYRYCYGGINRTNYVIQNVQKMVDNTASESSRENLRMIIAESKLMRALIYFRLITWWGDVPYFGFVPKSNDEVATLSRTPIAAVKDSIMADLEYATENLPDKAVSTGHFGRPAAFALRGKVELYWASWNHFGWPELDTFKPSEDEATKAYTAAAKDFRHVIDDFGLDLFRHGEPGDCDSLGRAEILPNYYYLFLPTANGDDEFVLAFAQGGTGTDQSEQLMRDFAGRSIEYSQGWVIPRANLADRYQSTITGDFCDKLIPMNPSTRKDARTAKNSALNPQSYANRDYRMKSTLLWDYEMSMGLMSLKETGWVPFIYKLWGSKVTLNGVTYTSYENINCNSGYEFRKFVRNYAGQSRTDGDFNWPVIRLADVFLMYAEADNMVNGPQPYAVNLVNRIRHRGNLPPLKADKYATKEAFFDAIKQERIVELVGEGHRIWDMRRWREMEDVYGGVGGPGKIWYDTYGAQQNKYWDNATEQDYQRCYIFQIPESERNRNPNLTQNKPWR